MRGSLKTIVDTFSRNLDDIRALDHNLMKPQEFQDWQEGLDYRASNIQAIFKENEALLFKLKEVLAEEMDDDLASELAEVVFELYKSDHDDLLIENLICAKIVPYFEEHKTRDTLINLYAVLSYEYYDCFGRTLEEQKDVSKSIECYKKVIAYKDEYLNIASSETRRKLYLAYANLLAPLAAHDKELRKDVFKLYDEAYDLYEHGIKVLDDMSLEDFSYTIDNGILSMEAFLYELSEEEIAHFAMIVEKISQKAYFDDSEGNLYRAKQSLSIWKKEKTAEELIEEYIKYLKNLPAPDYTLEDETESFNLTINYFNSAWAIIEIFNNFALDDDLKRKYASEFVDLVSDVLVHVPYGFMTSTFNETLALWFYKVRNFLPSFNAKKELLCKTILARQPQTYIHSLMVKNLSEMCAMEMLKDQPQLLTCEKIEPQEMVSFVGLSALLHDIGKCVVADIINQQSRKLSEFELKIVRDHPFYSAAIVENDPDFAAYREVMLGHHRNYDGSGGYPDFFDNTKSAYKNVIDLVTICDSLDAATDRYGRNYARAKRFDEVFQELEDSKGVKYNPEMVTFIKNHQYLYNELKVICENRRGGIYFTVYNELMGIK